MKPPSKQVMFKWSGWESVASQCWNHQHDQTGGGFKWDHKTILTWSKNRQNIALKKKQTHANTNQTAKQRKHTVTYICIHTCNMYMIFSKTLHTHLSKFYIYRFSALVCFLFCSQTVRCLPSVPIQLLTLGALDPLGFNVDTSFPSFINIEMIWQGQQHYTSWKFNMAPENKPSQKESNLPTIIFQRLCYTLGVYIIYFWDGQQ